MKLNPKSNSMPQQIFEHPWYAAADKLKRPNPPTKEAVERAKFVDKTYVWKAK
jgi:hypothetical protein